MNGRTGAPYPGVNARHPIGSWSTLALVVVVAACARQGGDDGTTVRTGATVIGPDDRLDYYSVPAGSPVKAELDATLPLVHYELTELTASTSTAPGIGNLDLGEFHYDEPLDSPGHLCPEVPFYYQFHGNGVYCSGALVAPDLLLTCYHCAVSISGGGPFWNNDQTVLGYHANSSDPHDVVGQGIPYIPFTAMVDGNFVQPPPGFWGEDWALLRLQSPVPSYYRPMPVRRMGSPPAKTPIYGIGYPLGLPVKYSPNAVSDLKTGQPANTFMASVDLWAGNSGSPVFNGVSREIEGVMAGSGDDFTYDSTRGCYAPTVVPDWPDGTFDNLAAQFPGRIIPKDSRLSVGLSVTCLLGLDGTPYCLGYNGIGQVGDGTTTTRSAATLVGLTDLAEISAGGTMTCARSWDRRVWCWGYNGDGQLGNGNTVSQAAPGLALPGFPGDALHISAGIYSACGVAADSTVRCWGLGAFGAIGNGGTADATVPTQVTDGTTMSQLTNADQISVGGYHACALLKDRTVRCWGYNAYGELGDGTTTTRTTATPVYTSAGVMLSNVVQLTTGGYHTCARLRDDSVRCWGYNGYGELGDGTSTSRSFATVVSTPIGTSDLVGGMFHTCALGLDDLVRCWGSNGNGQLGTGSTGNASVPTLASPSIGPVAELASTGAGGYHSCARLQDGTVRCWGDDTYGELGDGTTGTASRPALTMPTIGGVVQISAGGYHTCAMMRDGGPRCWGYNGLGQLGDNTVTQRPTPTRPAAFDIKPVSVSTGIYHTCAVLAGRFVTCWGYNSDGQLGVPAGASRTVPPTGAEQLRINAVSVAPGYRHTCSVIYGTVPNVQTVQCWGNNSSGQLGDGTTTTRSTPAAVSGLYGVTQVVTGYDATCALLTNGTVYCWGWNGYGQLGNGTTTSSSAPVQVLTGPGAGLGGVTSISMSYLHVCAVVAGGPVKCWGRNTDGELGDGTQVNRSYATSVSNISSASEVAAGGYHTCARLGGTTFCWGYNGYGEIGTGATGTDKLVPTYTAFDGISQLTAGFYQTCGIRADGNARCWGYNGYGELGDGTTTNRPSPTPLVF